MWLLAPFVHTRPHSPPPARWEVSYVRREDMRPDGTWCAWEAESLSYDQRPLWSAEPPDGELWCTAPFEAARMVDVQGEDGPFLSVRLTEWECCPDREVMTACRTYDLRTGQPATLEDYDPKHYRWRSWRLARVLERRDDGAEWAVDPSAFLVGGGHVRVCATRGDEVLEVPLR